eukprot:scaffold106168_cov57-Phaeocystis_antarctica.AAC.2
MEAGRCDVSFDASVRRRGSCAEVKRTYVINAQSLAKGRLRAGGGYLYLGVYFGVRGTAGRVVCGLWT